MAGRDSERFIRWENYLITQLSFSINLFLGFAVASLAYVINLKLNNSNHLELDLNIIILWWSFSAFFGSLATLSRLLDYRHTARKIRYRGKCNILMAKYCTPVSWGFFWVQVVCFVIGSFLFISVVVSA
jgi:hypothetical protein